MQSYQQLERIGKGSSGKIYRLRNIYSGKVEALKKVSLSGLSAAQVREAEQEIFILRSLHHPNVVRYKDSFVSGSNLCIITEYCELGDLSRYLKNSQGPLSENEVLRIFIQVLLGVEYLHKKQILHRDLKAMNVFLKRGMVVKIGDLGIARHLSESLFASTVVGTPFYLSPELCSERPYNYKSDIWALGCLLYELCCREPPFKATATKSLKEQILSNEFADVPNSYSGDMNRLVRSILKTDPRDRPSIEELLSVPFIRCKMDELELTPNNFTLKIKNNRNQQTPQSPDPKESHKRHPPFIAEKINLKVKSVSKNKFLEVKRKSQIEAVDRPDKNERNQKVFIQLTEEQPANEEKSVRKNVGDNLRAKKRRSAKDKHHGKSLPSRPVERTSPHNNRSLPKSLENGPSNADFGRSFYSDISQVEHKAAAFVPMKIQSRNRPNRPAKKSIIKVVL